MRILVRDPNKGYLDNWFWIPKKEINVPIMKNGLTIKVKEGKNEENYVYLFRETDNHLLVARGMYDESEAYSFDIIDATPELSPQIRITSKIELDYLNRNDTTQRDAFESLTRDGILCLACGKGKTIIALHYIATIGAPALVLVPDTQLLEQWKAQALKNLCLEPKDIGELKSATRVWDRPLVLGTYHTVAAMSDSMPEQMRRHFRTVIWDEGHHVGAETFSKTAYSFYGRRLILSATPVRNDGRDLIYRNHIGPVIHKNLKQRMSPQVILLNSGCVLDPNDEKVAQEICDKSNNFHYVKLAIHLGRNIPRIRKIVDVIRVEAAQQRDILVLSYSTEELFNIYSILCNQAMYKDETNVRPKDVGFEDVAHTEEIDNYEELKQIYDTRREPGLYAILRGHEAHIAVIKRKKQLRRQFIAKALTVAGRNDIGFVIEEVKAAGRKAAISKRVILAVAKYGKEAFDKDSLSTVIMCEPVVEETAGEGSLAQVIGRVLRAHPTKPAPRVIAIKDQAPLISGLFAKMKRALKNWPEDQGGPFEIVEV